MQVSNRGDIRLMNEINGISCFGRLTMKQSTKGGWDDESENMSRTKCKGERERERVRERERERERAERTTTQNSIHVFQEAKLNYILSLRTRDGIITVSVRKYPRCSPRYVAACVVQHKGLPQPHPPPRPYFGPRHSSVKVFLLQLIYCFNGS